MGVPFKKMLPEILCFVSTPPNTLKNIPEGFYIFEIHLLLSLFSHDTEYPMGMCSMRKYDVYNNNNILILIFFRRALERVRPLGKALWVGHCQPRSPQESCWGPLVVMPCPSFPLPLCLTLHMTHGKMPPPTKKEKKRKEKTKKKPSAQPPKKEIKKERCIGSWRKNWSNCSFAVVTYRKNIHSSHHTNLVLLVTESAWLPKNRMQKRKKKKKNPITHLI